MERLLLLKVASRGDLLLAAPAFRYLRERRPAAFITLLVGRSCEDVSRYLPYFDEIVILDDHSLLAGTWIQKLREAAGLLRTMRTWRMAAGRHHETAEILIFHRDWRYGLLAWLAGISVRRGFASRRGTAFLTHPYPAGGREHHADQYLGMSAFGDAANADDIRPSSSPGVSMTGTWRFADAERESALLTAASHGYLPTAGDWVALGFGGGRNVKMSTELKSWPVERYKALAVELAAQGWKVVWLGDQADRERLGRPPLGLNLAGELSVPQTAAVLSTCSLVVANDTLVLHLAGALGRPTIGLFGPTDPAHYQPRGELGRSIWLGPELVPCSPCHRNGFYPPCRREHLCMTGLDVASVLAVVRELSSPKKGAGGGGTWEA